MEPLSAKRLNERTSLTQIYTLCLHGVSHTNKKHILYCYHFHYHHYYVYCILKAGEGVERVHGETQKTSAK